MRKDEAKYTELVKHTRNSRLGKRGVNKRRRREIKKDLRKE